MYRKKKPLQCKKALGIVSRLIQNIHRDFNILHKETCSFQLSKWFQASLFYLQQSVCFYGRHQGFSSDTSESLMVTDLLSTLSEFYSALSKHQILQPFTPFLTRSCAGINLWLQFCSYVISNQWRKVKVIFSTK